MTARPAAEIAADRIKSAVDGLAQLERAARVQVALRGSTITRLEKELAERTVLLLALIAVHGETSLSPSDISQAEGFALVRREGDLGWLYLGLRKLEPVT